MSPIIYKDYAYSIKVFFDTDKIFPSPAEDFDHYPHHESKSGTDYSKKIPKMMEYGGLGVNEPATYIVRNLTNAYRNDKFLLQWFAHALETRGFKVVIK